MIKILQNSICRVVKLAALLGLCLFTVSSYALTFKLSEKDVDMMAKASFPQTQLHEGMILTFSDPEVDLGVANNDVSMVVTMKAEKTEGVIIARGKISGQLAWRRAKKELQIEKPVLSDLKILENKMSDATGMIEGVKAIQGKVLPVILLLDMNEMELGIFANQLPRSMAVRDEQLIIEM
ncbi:hypothetical protein [Alteromonas ponticola]|uniref:TIGR02281 family clan AA aspartic protease n=1 Tax=Alteromonas ponticola TaxID=2720613 RepID=A0ABX1R3R8_9ALTE|nr:hypothetical protein [Alteromonas ponticola]NMH59893.1 hypothetical protein [Alteromonas ponticola]